MDRLAKKIEELLCRCDAVNKGEDRTPTEFNFKVSKGKYNVCVRYVGDNCIEEIPYATTCSASLEEAVDRATEKFVTTRLDSLNKKLRCKEVQICVLTKEYEAIITDIALLRESTGY